MGMVIINTMIMTMIVIMIMVEIMKLFFYYDYEFHSENYFNYDFNFSCDIWSWFSWFAIKGTREWEIKINNNNKYTLNNVQQNITPCIDIGGKRLEYRMQVFTRHISLSLKSAHGHCNDVARIIFILRAVLYTLMGLNNISFFEVVLRQRRVVVKNAGV